MTRSLMIAFMLLPSSALAGVSDYSGTYDLDCEDASVSLHVSAAGGVGGVVGSWSDTLNVTLECDGIDTTEQADLADDIADDCTNARLDATWCSDLGDTLAAGVADFNNDAVALIPEEVDLTVLNTWNWFYRMMNLYPTSGTHSFADGSSRYWQYVMTGGGRFSTARIAVVSSASSSILSCADAAVGGVSGSIDASDDYALSSQTTIDRSLYCLASDGGDWLLAQVGIAFQADVSGERL